MNRTLKITGMSCDHCVAAVKKALEELPGVSNVTVSLDEGVASLRATHDAPSDAALSQAVKNAGYQVESIA